jgi:hypothetical protein
MLRVNKANLNYYYFVFCLFEMKEDGELLLPLSITFTFYCYSAVDMSYWLR